MENVNWLPTSPFPRDPLYPSGIYAGGAGPQTSNLDLEDEYFPFRVYVMEQQSTSGTQENAKVGIEYKSTVYKNENGFGFQAITGLLTDRLDFQDPGWVQFPDDETIVYLKGTVAGGVVTEINVDWDLTPEQFYLNKRLEGGSPVTPQTQTGFYFPIARLFRYGENPQRFGVEQIAKTHLFLGTVKFGDDEGLYPVYSPSGGGSVNKDNHAFEPYMAPFEGAGTPPLDQNRKIKIRRGYFGSVLPGNIDAVFTVPPNSYELFYASVGLALNGNGANVVSASIVMGDMPDAPDSSDSLPTPVYVPIFYVSTGEGTEGINGFSKMLKTNLNGSLVIANMDCSHIYRQWVWQYGGPSNYDY